MVHRDDYDSSFASLGQRCWDDFDEDLDFDPTDDDEDREGDG